VVGGNKVQGKGYFVEPTVLVDTNPEMKVECEEIFGPVVTAVPFTDVKDVVKAGAQHDLRAGRGRVDQGHFQGRIAWPTSCARARSG